jgi:Ca2+:H+ antiporter
MEVPPYFLEQRFGQDNPLPVNHPEFYYGFFGVTCTLTVVGIVIATLVLLPQTWAAVRAARANRLESSMNPAIGSALAGIGLTVPIVVPASIVFDSPLVLGLEPKDLALPALTFVVSAINASCEWVAQTFLSVRARHRQECLCHRCIGCAAVSNMMQGAMHLVLIAAFGFPAFVP